ncbi:hypothetical protein QBC35DRAFT_518154 [Podospora australis]|uniref:MARVEL domain-containing protein n=1 Tax=Podospora australis TaxID=1536484 RepID=A0AAN6WLL5_9PEZI|nr:hypothetical protein QBC35DRAFT_518154 [Podospora australis]
MVRARSDAIGILKTVKKERPSLDLVTDFEDTDAIKMRFQPPHLGALGLTFTVMRAGQFASLIAVIGLCANFISVISHAEHSPPGELIAALTVSVIAVLYVVISYILYYDNMLPMLLTSGIDGLFLIACIVVAALLGKPLSSLSCASLPDTDSVLNLVLPLPSPIPVLPTVVITKTISLPSFVRLARATCYEMKAVWGLSITLCVLFAFSSMVGAGLWQRVRRESKKDIEG